MSVCNSVGASVTARRPIGNRRIVYYETKAGEAMRGSE